jgi:hypothetical protein
MRSAVIQAVYATEGSPLGPGGKLVDLCVDLSSVAQHDCPAISYFRIAVRDRAYVRILSVARGDEIAIGAPIAQLSTEPGEPLEGVPARAARVAIAGILYQPEWWNGQR